MTVNRADDIWLHTHIIQDIATLISRSRIIVADGTGNTANVFYEIGIAHAIGREVIVSAQSTNDIPFDLRHLRAISYLNNGEGWPRGRRRSEIGRRRCSILNCRSRRLALAQDVLGDGDHLFVFPMRPS